MGGPNCSYAPRYSPVSLLTTVGGCTGRTVVTKLLPSVLAVVACASGTSSGRSRQDRERPRQTSEPIYSGYPPFAEPGDLPEPEARAAEPVPFRESAGDREGSDEQPDVGRAEGEPDHKTRLFRTSASGFVHIGSLSYPGYYTLILFSAKWCAPCRVLWSEAPTWVEEFPNLVVVDVDVGEGANADGALDGPEAAVLQAVGMKTLPAALCVGPFGQTVGASEGIDQIRGLVKRLRKRTYTTPIPFRLDALGGVTPGVGSGRKPSKHRR